MVNAMWFAFAMVVRVVMCANDKRKVNLYMSLNQVVTCAVSLDVNVLICVINPLKATFYLFFANYTIY